MYSKYIKYFFYSNWCLLGVKRGVDEYNYKHPTDYLYRNMIANGILGGMVYGVFPICGFAISKEIYRTEVYLRNLENEYTKLEYYNLI
jgi:hypothetical protein